MSMNLKLISRPYLQEDMRAEEIAGFANGCFSVLARDKTGAPVFFLYNAKGECIVPNVRAEKAVLLNSNAYITVDYPDKPRLFNYYLTTLHAPNGLLIKKHLAAFKVYANGWYLLHTGDCNELYNANHELIAKGFSQCVVYDSGYALRANATYYQYADWRLFDANGVYLGNCRNIAAILGDGLPLMYDMEKQSFSLLDQSGNVTIAHSIEGFKNFPNGRFVLSFCKGIPEQHYLKIFDANGKAYPAIDADAICLPDGRFLHCFNSKSYALYCRNAIMASTPLWWHYQLAGNYYLLHVDGVNTLFNDKQEDLGEGYTLEGVSENFTLCKNEGAYHLFNQYGNVLSLPYEE